MQANVPYLKFSATPIQRFGTGRGSEISLDSVYVLMFVVIQPSLMAMQGIMGACMQYLMAINLDVTALNAWTDGRTVRHCSNYKIAPII